MNTKLAALKQYIDKQADDHFIWYKTQLPAEKYLQEEIRRVAWLIEVASVEEIEKETKKYEGRL